MKKLLLTLILGVLPLIGFAQDENFAEFQMSYFKTKSNHYIQLTDKNGELQRIFVEGFSMDNTSKDGMFIIDAKKINSFKDYLTALKDKYKEWSETAKINNVTTLDKDIPVAKTESYGAGFKYGSWQFDFSVSPSARFKIIDGQTLLIIDSQKLQSSSNRYIDSKGLVLVFSSADEIQNLIDKLDVAKMSEKLKENTSKTDLFK